MATNSKSFRPSLRRCRASSRRREASPRSPNDKGKAFRKSSPSLRFTNERVRVARPRMGERYMDKELQRRRELSGKTRTEPSTRRLPANNGYSELKYSDDAPKCRHFLQENGIIEWDRNDSRHIRGSHRSRTYEKRGDQRGRTRRLSGRVRSRSGDGIRQGENYDDRESHRSIARIPEIHDHAESRLLHPEVVRRPPLAVAVPRPTRILLPPRLVPHPPHMRLPFTTRVIPAAVRPVLLAPVVILRTPMMPLRPQPVGPRN